jgi:hypothetical protein
MMGTLDYAVRQVQCQPAEVMSNSQLEPNSLNLALSTRVTEHESGTCASPWSHCILQRQQQASASRYLTVGCHLPDAYASRHGSGPHLTLPSDRHSEHAKHVYA